MRQFGLAVTLSALWGCSAASSELPSAPPESGTDGGEVPPSSCPQADPLQEREALRAYAERVAPQLVDAEQVGPGVFRVRRVARGFGLWAGDLIRSEVVHLEEAYAALGAEPWRFAIDGWIEHQGGGTWSGTLQPVRPANDVPPAAPQLDESIHVLSARLERIEGNQLFFATEDVLRGEAPPNFYALMLVRDHPLPVRPTSRWLIGVRSFNFVEAQDTYLAEWADMRSDTPDYRQAALVDHSDGLSEVPELWNQTRAWIRRLPFRLSRYALQTRVAGMIDECGTAAGGRAVLHTVEANLRGAPIEGSVAIGGHGYFYEGACGTQHRLAIDTLGFEGDVEFSCPSRCGPGYLSNPGWWSVLSEGEEGWDEAVSDAVAPGPTLLEPSTAERPNYPIRPDGPWSFSPSLGFTLSAADRFQTFSVQEAEPWSEGWRVEGIRLEDDARLQLFMPCEDPRLVPGALLDLPTVRLSYLDTHMLVPGLLLEGPVDTTLARFVHRIVQQRARNQP